MSHLQQHHHHQPQYVHYTGPPGTTVLHTQIPNHNVGIAPQDTTRQPQQQPHHQHQQQHQQHQALPQPPQQQQQPIQTGPAPPLVATGDWTKDLVHLAKTAELKKHALTLQLHTAHILSAHAALEQKNKAIQDLREQKNKLESERTRLLNCLREINEDRDKADLMEASINRECHDIRIKITQLTDGEYSTAKNDVDRLRQELGQPPLPSLQSTLDEKTSQYLNERRLNGNEAQSSISTGSNKRNASEASPMDTQPSAGKRPRGRPKGSKNRTKGGSGAAGSSAGVGGGVM